MAAILSVHDPARDKSQFAKEQDDVPDRRYIELLNDGAASLTLPKALRQ